MSKRIVARWQDWSGVGREYLVLSDGPDAIIADSAIITEVEGEALAVRYRIECDLAWRVRKVEIARIGDQRALELTSDGLGNWRDGGGNEQPRLRGAIDIDISVTPFTNTLPIRRLQLSESQSAEIVVVYIQLPGLSIATDPQRYTQLAEGRYRYESRDTDFTREIDVDANGLVITYPGLFRRTA